MKTPWLPILFLIVLQAEPARAAINSSTYHFTTGTGFTLQDMSSGTTDLIPPDSGNVASVVQNIGFDFWLDGTRYTQFSVSSNGFCRLGSVAASGTDSNFDFGMPNDSPEIATYWDSLRVGTNGHVHFKVVGAEPNRILVVEWNNIQIPVGSAGQTGAGTFQMWLYESSGIIEFYFGSGMVANNVGGGYTLGIASYVDPMTNNIAAITTTPPSVSYVSPSRGQTDAIPASTKFALAPNTPNVASNLSFTNIAPTSMTVNWSDNAFNETGYVVYVSTDGTHYTFATEVAANSTSANVIGLSPSTNYFVHVAAVTEGALGFPLSGNQATLPASVSSTFSGGNWSSTTTWGGGVLPTADQDVMITNAATVTINTAAVAKSVTIGTGAGSAAILQFEATTARTLTVGNSVTIRTNGTLQSSPSGTQKGHLLSIGGDLTNNGTLDLQKLNTGADLKFTGANSNTFSSKNATRTNIRTLTIDKGNSTSSELIMDPPDLLISGTTTDGTAMAFLTLVNGLLSLDGSEIVSSRLFTSASYTIPATAGLRVNNPNFHVAGQNGSPTINGLVQISKGTFNAGTAFNNSLSAGTGASFVIDGGTLNIAGRFYITNVINYTQSSGTVNVCTVGQNMVGAPSFGPINSIFTMSGGTINLVQASGALDYQVNPPANITGGTLNIGTAATVSDFLFVIGGAIPGFVTDTTTNNKNALLFLNSQIYGNSTISSGTNLDLNGFPCAILSPSLTNNGSISAFNVSSTLSFSGMAAQNYSGTGSINGPLTVLTIDNPSGVAFDPSGAQFVTLRLNLINGSVTNANKLTIGNGGSTAATLQIGNSTTASAPGTFDSTPVYNVGTGGLSVLYLRGSTPRTTGSEIGGSRTLTNLTLDDNAFSNAFVTLLGGDLTVTGTTTLTNGRFVTGSSTVIIPTSGTVTRTNGSIEGNLRKTLTATGNKAFEVGTADGYSPVTIGATGGSFPATVTIGVTHGRPPSYPSINALKRYWTVNTPATLSGDLMFTYFINDIGTRAAANFKMARFNGSLSAPGSIVNTSTNTLTVPAMADPPPLSGDWFILGTADSDLDGLPDSYELAHTSPQSATSLTPNGDADGDGVSNLAEYNAGTDPLNPNDYLRITSITKDANGVQVTCTATDLATYELEYKNAITDPAWNFLRFSNPHVGMSTTPIPDVTVGSALQRFYRVTLDVDDQL